VSEPSQIPAGAHLGAVPFSGRSPRMYLLDEQLVLERMRQLRGEAESSARANRILAARRLARKAQRAEAAARRARQAATAIVVW